MAQVHNDEVDLVYVIKKIKEILKGWIVLLFKAIGFALKFWWVILILILIGFGYGYYEMKDAAKPKKSKIIVRVNYELQNYFLNSIELYNAKAKMNDSIYLEVMGLNRWNPEIKEIQVAPMIDFKDILEEYDVNERSLESLLKNVDFEGDDKPLRELFVPKYNYFELDISLASKGNETHISRFIDYVNSDSELREYKIEAKKNLEVVIAHNIKSMSLIDTILQSYVGLGSASSSNVIIEKDLDLNRLIESKLEIQKQNHRLKNELILSNDIVVPLHNVSTREGKGRLLNKKHIVYPILLVFLFFLVAYLRYVYLYLRNVARENSN